MKRPLPDNTSAPRDAVPPDSDPYRHPAAAPPEKRVRIGPLGWTVIGLLVLAVNAWLWPRMLGFL